MSDPDRLADSAGDEPGVALLRAARVYRLSEETRQRAFAAVGLAAGTTAFPTGKAAAKGMALKTKLLGWTLAGVAGVGAAVGGYRALAPGETPARPNMHSAPSTVGVTSTPPAPFTAAPQSPAPQAALPPVESTPPAPSAPTIMAPRLGASSAGSHGAAPADLQAELAALDAASNALGRGDAVHALALLDAYVRDFPRASLAAEATVLRAEALEHAGRHSEAVQLALAFVKRNPKSPLAERMHRIAGD